MTGRTILRTRWGATFNTDAGSFHTYKDFGLLPESRPVISPPETDIYTVHPPGGSGRIRLRLTDWPTYDTRPGMFSYYLPGTDRKRFDIYSAVQTILHGREGTVTLDEDSGFYWQGFFTVEGMNHGTAAGILTIRGDLDPYKWSTRRTDQAWLWDPFSFETGVIREYGSMTVDGSLSVTVISSPAGGLPTVILSDAMTVNWDGTSYSLSAGTHVLTAEELPHGETAVPVTFTGTGTATIRFRAGYL